MKYRLDPTAGPFVDADRLRQVRHWRGLTAREVAAAAEISLRQLQRLESGQRPYVAAVTLARLAAALGTTLEYLLGMTEDPAPLPGWGEPPDATQLG